MRSKGFESVSRQREICIFASRGMVELRSTTEDLGFRSLRVLDKFPPKIDHPNLILSHECRAIVETCCHAIAVVEAGKSRLLQIHFSSA